VKSMINPALYYVTDDRHTSLDDLVNTSLKAVDGGATLVQLRNPSAKAGMLIVQAKALIAALKDTGVPLIINDRPDVAFAAGAAGVHLGQDDLPAGAARALLGPHAVIGLSITHHDQLPYVPWEIIDHIGVGPVISKGVKSDAAEPMGIQGLATCVRLSRKPVVAIGGLDLSAVKPCIDAGADGLAFVSAISRAVEPEAAARELRRAIDHALKQRGQK
jgi:thiamine-phosphate pyrophosphorylase